MADTTTLNVGTGGDVIMTEQVGGTGTKYPVSKIYTGALDVNGGPVTAANPFDVRIGDATNTANVKAASTAAVAADKALVTTQSPNRAEQVGATAALGALNATATVNAAGYSSVGMFLAAGTLVGTIVTEASYDGGTTWTAAIFDSPATGTKVASFVFGSANTATSSTIVGFGGASQYRVRVSVYTSGTANCTLRATDIADPSLHASSTTGAAVPTVALSVGGSDGTNLQSLRLTPAAIASAILQGLVVRPYVASDGTNITPTMDAAARKAFHAVTDGTNVAAVKAASTAPTTADPALVVALSPNSPVAQGDPNATGISKSWFCRIGDATTGAKVSPASTMAAAADPAIVVVQTINAIATYSAASSGIAPAASATDIFILNGSATKIVRVRKIIINATQTTAGNVGMSLIKRSTANSGGTIASITAVPHDSNDAAVTAVAQSYSANPTSVGTQVGFVRVDKYAVQVPATVSAPLIWEFGGDSGRKPIVLRGTAQGLAVNLGGVTVTGGAFTVDIEWTESTD